MLGETAAKAKELTELEHWPSCDDSISPIHSYSVVDWFSIEVSSDLGIMGTVHEIAWSFLGSSLSSHLTLEAVGRSVL